MIILEKIIEQEYFLNLIADWRNQSLPMLRSADLTKKGISQINWVRNLKESEKYYFIFSDITFIGYCGLDKIYLPNKTAEISLLIGPQYQKKGYGNLAIKKLLELGFNNFNLNLIFGEVYKTTDNWKFWKKQGFKQEAVLRQRKYYKGKYYDSIIFSLTKKEWDKLNDL